VPSIASFTFPSMVSTRLTDGRLRASPGTLHGRLVIGAGLRPAPDKRACTHCSAVAHLSMNSRKPMPR
jgi:hypothetical protein